MAPKPVEANVQTSGVKTSQSAFTEDIYRVPETINFPQEEEQTLKFWSENKVFEKCLQQSKGKPK